MAKVKIVLVVEDMEEGISVKCRPYIDAVPEDVTGAMTLGYALHDGLQRMVMDLFEECQEDPDEETLLH